MHWRWTSPPPHAGRSATRRGAVPGRLAAALLVLEPSSELAVSSRSSSADRRRSSAPSSARRRTPRGTAEWRTALRTRARGARRAEGLPRRGGRGRRRPRRPRSQAQACSDAAGAGRDDGSLTAAGRRQVRRPRQPPQPPAAMTLRPTVRGLGRASMLTALVVCSRLALRRHGLGGRRDDAVVAGGPAVGRVVGHQRRLRLRRHGPGRRG